ncbi:MAG: DUF924 family protein [Kiloniellaceae bacterium]
MTTARIAEAVLSFWFAEGGDAGAFRAVWFERRPAFDAEIASRFRGAFEQAARGALDGLAATPRGSLALVLLLDQFPRNLFRGSRRAFATDAKARARARSAVARGFDRDLAPLERHFLYLPFQHSEDLADQRLSVRLFASLASTEVPDDAQDHARRHLEVIGKFGRFPHRNAALGRDTTAPERRYLAGPAGRYWLGEERAAEGPARRGGL